MNFIEWWKTSSAKASEDYYELRFDESEIKDFRNGLLNPTARMKFNSRVKKFAKMSGALIGGCLSLILLLMMPFACMFAYSFYTHPSIGMAIFGAVLLIFIIVGYSLVALKLFNLSKGIKQDLKNGFVSMEQGQLTIKVWTQNETLHKTYAIKNVEFKVLEDAIGAEIHRQFLSPVVTTADSRTTIESYRFYYLPLSKLILYYEQI